MKAVTLLLLGTGPGLAAMIAGPEILSRFLIREPFIDPTLLSQPYKSERIFHNRKGCSSPSLFTMNRIGLRGEDPDFSKPMYIALGSSVTRCRFNDDRKAWPRLLQDRLGAWVGNAGGDGLTLKSQYALFDNYARIKPKAFLMMAGSTEFAESLRESRRILGSPYDIAFSKRLKRNECFAGLLRHSWLVRTGYSLFCKSRPIQDIHVENTSEFRLESGKADSVKDTSIIHAAVSGFRSHLVGFMAKADSAHVGMIFLTQPGLYDSTAVWEGKIEGEVDWDGERKRISAAQAWGYFKRFNEATLSLEAEGARVIDLAEKMPKDPALYIDAFHLSDSGCAVAARIVSQELEKSPLPI